MCRTVFIRGSVDWYCETQHDLRKMLGDLLYIEGTPEGAKGDDTGCLCWVDVEGIAAREGYTVENDGADLVLKPRG